MCDAQGFITNTFSLMQDFKLSDAPPPIMREVLDLFPPQRRLPVAKVLTTCRSGMLAGLRANIASDILLAVPTAAQGCSAATFDICRLWEEAPAAPGSNALAFDRLNRSSSGRQQKGLSERELPHTSRAFDRR
jgi:hypothetical protein